MDWKLEVVVIPVTDADRSKKFYSETLGFNVDHDNAAGDNFRVVQVTPPGSYCSVAFGIGLAQGTPGEIGGLQLTVPDLRQAQQELERRGLESSGIQFFDPESGPRAPAEDENLDFNGFIFFADPDGNSWAIQQISPGQRPGLD